MRDFPKGTYKLAAFGRCAPHVIGIFDSGVGGLAAYKEVRRLAPQADIVYLADRKNAPYGTKGREELIKLVNKDVSRLREMGATDILIACCTASTVYPYIEDAARERTLPIIEPAADAAKGLHRVTVIATEHTVTVSAFGNALKARDPSVDVMEIPVQELVKMVERGARDGEVPPDCMKCLRSVANMTRRFGSDGMILGCTHFSHLENTLGTLLPEVKIISPAREGARKLASIAHERLHGRGVDIYI